MTIYCDAVTPDGREVHFDDVIATGDVVTDERTGEPFLVGLDRGDEPPLLHPIGADEWNAWMAECQRRREARWREPTAPVSEHGIPVQEEATDAR